MPQSQSQLTDTQAASTKTPSYLYYELEKGGVTMKRKIPILPFQSIMVDGHGGLIKDLWHTNNTQRPKTMETAWQTKEHHDSEDFIVLPEKLPVSLCTRGQITPLPDSFALIDDGNGAVQWEMRKVADDGSIITTSGTHYQEELKTAQSVVADGTEVAE